MKRLLIFAALIVAIGSFGGHILSVNAQTLTPDQTAALQQQLDVAKATLANLEMQAGTIPPVDAGTPSTIPASIAGTGSETVTPVAVAPSAPVATTGLTADQLSAFQTTLGTLAATLSQLNTSLAANTTLTPSQDASVGATLNGMQGTLVAMANTIATANSTPVASAPVSAPVAVTQPSAPVAVNSSPSAVPTAPAPAAPIAQAPVATTPAPTVAAAPSTPAANTAPQTAQVSSLWSFTKSHWPTIVIILLVIAILAILFWPEKEEVRMVSTTNSGSGKPKSAPIPPTSTVTMSQHIASDTVKTTISNNTPPPATPVANAVAAPSQK